MKTQRTKQQKHGRYLAWVGRPWLWPWERPLDDAAMQSAEQRSNRAIESEATFLLQGGDPWLT
jgi:hypothetical protein